MIRNSSPIAVIGTSWPGNVSPKVVVYGLVLIWLALTGSFEGWMIPVLLTVNGYLAAITLVWCGWQLHRSGFKPLAWPLIIYWALLLTVTLIAGRSDPKEALSEGIGRLYLWVILFAVYHLPTNLGALQRGARWAGWLIFPLGILLSWENTNSMAMIFWSLYWLGLPAGSPWLFTGLATLAMLASQSEGGALAMLAGGLVYTWGRWGREARWWAVIALGGIVIATVASKIGDVGSFGNRIEIYTAAWQGITQSPWIGNGADLFRMTTKSGTPIYDQHNLLLNVLWETGLIGLVVMGWLFARALRRYHFPPWAAAWLITFICHSMVDGPLFVSFTTATSLVLILGGLPCKEKTTSLWPWPHPWAWRFFPLRRI